MILHQPEPRLALEKVGFAGDYNRMPFGFSHNLHQLGLFKDDALRGLCRRFADQPQDYFVSHSAPTPGTTFYGVPRTELKPHEAFDRLTAGSYKILLKRLERHDSGFRDLLAELFRQVQEQLQANGFCSDVVRLESSIFISAASTTTPFHFDPEVNFFCQIEGEKIYHLYPPSELAEEELEPLYVRATVDIGQVDLGRRDAAAEHVFELVPGSGLHQPQNAPHWVETSDSRSVSYTFVYETRESRSLSRVRSFNYYLRRTAVAPSRPGVNPTRDALKSGMMAALIPARQQVGKALRRWSQR